MVAALRAGIAVVMLVGFYVVALAQLGLAVLLAVVLAGGLASLTALKVTVPLFTATIGGVGVAIWKAFRTKPEPPHGLVTDRHQAPALWAAVDELAREVRTPTPKEIRLVPEVNAAVVEQPRLLGLVGGRRYLYVGLPLTQALTVDQLRSVLAHELGHYSRKHTRLAALTYRGRLVIAETLDRIGPYNVVGWVFKGYGKLFVLVANAVVRRQEYEADRAAARLAGRETAASALRELPVIDAAWDFFLRTYVRPGMEHGYVPSDLFGGFAELVGARRAELDELRARDPEQTASKWDTHPPIADRIAAIAALPNGPRPRDGRPASTLFPDPAHVGRRLQERMLNVDDPAVVSWPHFTNAMMTIELQREADRIFRTIARRTGVADVGLERVLDLIGAGRLVDLAEPFFPYATRREVGPLFAEVLEPLMALAATRSGVAGWQHSWAGPAQFVSLDGRPLPLGEAAKLAVSPGGLGEARRRLAEMGVHAAAAVLIERTASAVGAEVIAALANVKAGRFEHDLVLLNNGFVLVADPGKADDGRRRLRKLLESASASELAKRHWFLPYEEVASASVTKEVPACASLTLHDGRELPLQERWGSEMVTKESRDVLLQVLRSIGVN